MSGAGLAIRLSEVGQFVEQAAGLVEVAEDAGLMLAGAGLAYPLGDPVCVLQGFPLSGGVPTVAKLYPSAVLSNPPDPED
jgi:hypothetical protein